MADFAKEMDWGQFHSPRNLLLALELSDFLLYLVRLSDICGIDLGKAALRKVELNAIKYPASKQYTATTTNNGSDGTVEMCD
ncbi:embryonic stem cell-specific 5-hydroxymethylcytosine-binding protein-like isoform X1 [Hibiscus syriacus]|uniref:Embryonic stem cell-specific 5-hydroxymethylcytosine-binding protein-like isoform X1 n=1 Tax=Hibiscus syriacus TaxID=106335 RepID=A0A6A3BEA2_HIBSY|nr:embryonic stem cell-specific 5-hydroxymethylcytosine-binding protein-like isoform X1 [Hibiscus syriacus]